MISISILTKDNDIVEMFSHMNELFQIQKQKKLRKELKKEIKFLNKKLKSNHKTYIHPGIKLDFEKNHQIDLRGWGFPKTSDYLFENIGYKSRTVKNYFGFEMIEYKKLPFTDEIK